MMGRTHIHFADHKREKRKYEVFIHLDVELAVRWIKIYKNSIGTILTPGNDQGIVSTAFIKKVESREGTLLRVDRETLPSESFSLLERHNRERKVMEKGKQK